MGDPPEDAPSIDVISAITLATGNMTQAVEFYTALGFAIRHGGSSSAFITFQVGGGHLNLMLVPGYRNQTLWGRIILYVSDVDAMHARAIRNGLQPQFAPRDAPWGERYFHITAPDGHELSFAKPL